MSAVCKDTPQRDTLDLNSRIYRPEIGGTQLKEIINKKMDNINTYLYKAFQMKTELRQFDDSYEDCKQSIKSTAQMLIQKIQDHEARMLDELETQHELECKRLDLPNVKARMTEIERNFTNAQKNYQDIFQLDEASVPEMLNSEELKYTSLNTNEMDLLFDKLAELRCMMFSKIRCNTSFGTVELVHRKPIRQHSLSARKTSVVHPSPTKLSLDNQLYQHGSDNSNDKIVAGNALRKLRKFSLQMPMPIIPSTSPRVSKSPFSSRLSQASSDTSDVFSDETQTCELLWGVEKEGNGLGEVNCPSDVCFQADGSLVVCDRGNERVQIFNKTGEATKVIGENKIKPCRVSTTKNGQIILSDSRENNVCVYDKKGNCQTVLGKKLFKSILPFKAPCGVASRSGKQFIVSDVERNDVAIYNSDGKMVAEIGKQGGDCIEFKKPSYISVSQEGRILVSDNLNHCVKVFDAQGKFLFQCVLGGARGSQSDLQNDTNYLKYPNGVCCDDQGDIYVADWGSHTVSHFDRNGQFVRHVLTREDGIIHPAGVAVHGDQLAVCGYSDTHSSVQVFKMLPAQ